MNFEAMPILRMQIEGMKSAIVTHLGARGSELGEAMAEQVDKVIADYDWEGEVRRIVKATLTDKIQYYFKYGDGAKAVQDAVSEGFSAATITNSTK